MPVCSTERMVRAPGLRPRCVDVPILNLSAPLSLTQNFSPQPTRTKYNRDHTTYYTQVAPARVGPAERVRVLSLLLTADSLVLVAALVGAWYELSAPMTLSCILLLIPSASLTPPRHHTPHLFTSPPHTTPLHPTSYIAWLLYSTPVAVERVSLSYEKVVAQGEYWRAITASFAHYDLMHLGFNMMSLYNLGRWESSARCDRVGGWGWVSK